MKKYELNLALTDDLGQDVEKFEFEKIEDLTHKIISTGLEFDRVFLCCITDAEYTGELTEILVSENWPILMDFIENYEESTPITGVVKVFFFQFESFEDAYAVCLDMRENSAICYNQK